MRDINYSCVIVRKCAPADSTQLEHYSYNLYFCGTTFNYFLSRHTFTYIYTERNKTIIIIFNNDDNNNNNNADNAMNSSAYIL